MTWQGMPATTLCPARLVRRTLRPATTCQARTSQSASACCPTGLRAKLESRAVLTSSSSAAPSVAYGFHLGHHDRVDGVTRRTAGLGARGLDPAPRGRRDSEV